MSPNRVTSRLPLGLLGMLVLIGGVEGLIDREILPDSTTLAWLAARRAATHQGQDCQVLAFGDSLVKHGVATPLLEKALGVHAYNLALPGGQMAAHEALLRRAISRGARPRIILIDGEVLVFSPLQQTRLWVELLPLGELAELVRTVGDWRAATSLALEGLLPSLRRRDPLRQRLVSALKKGRLRLLVGDAAVHQRNWLLNRGAQLMPVLPLDPAVTRNIEGGPFGAHEANVPYLERFLVQAESIGATVVWLLPPIHPAAQAARDRGGYRETCRAFLTDLQSRHANLVVLDGQQAAMPHEAMFDVTHLNRDGACRYTAALAEALRPLLAKGPADSPRWITLTDYPEAPSESVEDLAESSRQVRRKHAEAALARRAQRDGLSR